MPDAVASSAAISRTTAITTWGAERPWGCAAWAPAFGRAVAGGSSCSPLIRHMLHAPPSRNPPTTSSTAPNVTGLQSALGRRDPGDPRVDRDRGAQRAGQRLELPFDDVVGVAAGVEHPHVQRDPR